MDFDFLAKFNRIDFVSVLMINLSLQVVSVSLHIRPRTLVLDTNILVGKLGVLHRHTLVK